MAGRKTTIDEQVAKLILENDFLKEKNTELAKALADQKAMYAEALKIRDELHRSYIDSERNRLMLMEGFKRITGLFSKMSSPFAEVGDEIRYLLPLLQTRNKVTHSPPPTSKTRAVKPMVSGHTIRRPTVSLARISAEQLVQMNASGSDGVPEENDIPETIKNHTDKQIEPNDVYQSEKNEEDNTMDADDIENEEELSTSARVSSRLETILEANESKATIINGSQQSALISGLFKDVNTYISTRSKKKKSTLSQANDCSSIISNAEEETMVSSQNAKLALPSVETSNNDKSTYQQELTENKLPEIIETDRSVVDSNTLLDVSNNADFTVSMFKVVPSSLSEKTSTPYTRTDIIERRHTTIDAINNNKENDCDSQHWSRSVTRRRHAILPNRTSTSAANGLFENCCVKVNKLSPLDLMKHQTRLVSETETPENSMEVNTGRPRRAKRPLNLKEPTLRHKMRR